MLTITIKRYILLLAVLSIVSLLSRSTANAGLFEQVILPGDTCLADGDANGDGMFDIADLTFMVSYLYLNGPAPEVLYRADFRADCVVDTLDLWEMANCAFNPGACLSKFTCCNPTPVFSTDTTARLGTVNITVDADTLRLDNISETGRDGVRLYRGENLSRGFSVDLTGADLGINNSGMSFEFTGLLINRDADLPTLQPMTPELQVMGGVGVFNTGGAIEVVADFNPLGDTAVAVVMLDSNNDTTGSGVVAGGGVIAIGNDAGQGLPQVLSVSWQAIQPPVFKARLDRRTKFTLTNSTILFGNTILLIAENANMLVTNSYAMDMNEKCANPLDCFVRLGLYNININDCCRGFRGNVDFDLFDFSDIEDLTHLIDHLFINFPSLCCLEEANIDGDTLNAIDIADLTALIDFLFINFTPPSVCE